MPDIAEEAIKKLKADVHASTFSIPQPQRDAMARMLDVIADQQRRIRALEKRFEDGEA